MDRLTASVLAGAAWALAVALTGSELPPGFVESVYTDGLTSPTAMAFTGDGRLLVCEQDGALRVVAPDGALLPQPFVTLAVSSIVERGLLGCAVDPAFAANGFVYVYYTATLPEVHNRVSRFTAAGDAAVAGSELVLLEIDPPATALGIHNGGGLAFGPDGKLYVAVGEHGSPTDAPLLTSLHGKLLRLDADGSIPGDNPFADRATGKYRAIWAIGLRNPFTFAFEPGTRRMLIGDVGADTWEEIDVGAAGADYGWPATEGPTSAPGVTPPLHAYGHGDGDELGCAVIGGAFSPGGFPVGFQGRYFFTDYCGRWLRTLDPATGGTAAFARQLPDAPAAVVAHPAGGLCYLSRDSRIYRIEYTGSLAPTIGEQPADARIGDGETATFTVAASGSPPLAYQWQRDGGDVAGATAATYAFPAFLADSGASFRCRVDNAFGTATSDPAGLTVVAGHSPTATIVEPAAGATWAAGDTIAYAGTAADPDQGALPASAFTWRVDLHHGDHVHPFLPASSGSLGGSFVADPAGHTESDIFLRIQLTVVDADGLVGSAFRDVAPRVTTLALASDPAGLQLTLDGQPVAAPHQTATVVGVARQVGAPSPQRAFDADWIFTSWSDGGAATHPIAAADGGAAATAVYRRALPGDLPGAPSGGGSGHGCGMGAGVALASALALLVGRRPRAGR